MAQSYSITGTVVKVGDTQKVSDKFRKADLWLSIEDGKYPQTVALEAHQDRIDNLAGLMEGETVTVHFDIRGRQWNDRVFNTLALWKIERETVAPQRPAQQPQAPTQTDTDVPW